GEGVPAAPSADPEVLANCTPRTGLGLRIRGMILEAGKGKIAALRMVMQFLDWKGDESPESRGISVEPEWDWSREGVWLTMPESEAEEDKADRATVPQQSAAPAAQGQ